MTETEKKALALVNEVRAEYPLVSSEVASNLALCRAIEQHEAFKREVSDAIQSCMLGPVAEERLSPFIIAKPVDPLVEVINDADDMVRKPDAPSYAEAIRAALAARGLEIREKQ